MPIALCLLEGALVFSGVPASVLPLSFLFLRHPFDIVWFSENKILTLPSPSLPSIFDLSPPGRSFPRLENTHRDSLTSRKMLACLPQVPTAATTNYDRQLRVWKYSSRHARRAVSKAMLIPTEPEGVLCMFDNGGF